MSSAAGHWCLIESDPGVFTELIKGFGVSGVQVEELYSLDQELFNSFKPIYGLVFLFKWVGNEKTDGTFVTDSRLDNIFFMRQVIENACATQAILSVLLNCDSTEVDLGETLRDFKAFAGNFDAETRGLTLSNSSVIRNVHNSFARQQMYEFEEEPHAKPDDAFHFVAYLPINGRLYELDGLKEAPIDLGQIPAGSDWTDCVKPVLEKRIMKYSEGEIRFNLMAIVPDKKLLCERELNILKAAASDANAARIKELEYSIMDEERRRLEYRKEIARRKHDYLPMVIEVLQILAERGQLSSLVNQLIEKKTARSVTAGKKN